MAEFYVEQQGWAHWPKVLIMCRKNGRDVTRRRYVQEVETGEGISITDELREYAWQHMTNNQEIRAIADRIDAEHEAQLNDAFETRNSDENLESDGWMRLPVDADGEYIHIGDVMDGTCPSGKHVNGTVNAIGDGVFWLSNVQFSLKPDYMHHHNAPTVEDVLDEFANRLYEKAAYFDEEHVQKAITEYAAKLRLAGDAE